MAQNYSITSLSEFAKNSGLFLKLRNKVLENLKQAGVEPNSLIALKGATDVYVWDTDTEREAYYESFSFNISGITNTNFILFIEVDSGEVHVFLPEFDDTLRLFLVPSTPESIHEKYGYKAYYQTQLLKFLADFNPTCIYLNKGVNTDSGTTVPSSWLDIAEIKQYKIDEAKLYEAFVRSRSVKLPEEIEIMRRVIRASSEAHVEILKLCKPGMKEFSLAGIFRSHISTNYGYIYAFPPISAAGNNASVLHYPYMESEIKNGDIVICDMGGYGFG